MSGNFFAKDIEKVLSLDVDWKRFFNRKIMVTGASGLIGSMTCRMLSLIAKRLNFEMKIIALSRNVSKTKEVLCDVLENNNIIFVEQDIVDEFNIPYQSDFIIHTACPTASNVFLEKPVETIEAIVIGTENLLKYAKSVKCESLLYLSSMEVYGEVLHESPLKPEDVGYINPLNLRSSYSEGKRIAESLCLAYNKEYQVPIKIIRLAQTFGPGVSISDGRVFAQFLRSAVNHEDIVMYTTGNSKRMYLDTLDAFSACITVLLQGESGKVYNAGNPETYCSIREMAELVAKEFGDGCSKVVIDLSKNRGQYPPDNKLFLDVTPLKQLGWTAQSDLKAMYKRMMKYVEMEAEEK